MYRRILVTLDGSKLSEAVLPLLEQFVTGTDASVTILRVAELPEHTTVGASKAPESLASVGAGPGTISGPVRRLVETRGQAVGRVRDEVEGYLEEKARALRAKGIEVESANRLGHPAEEIIDYATSHEVDVIMMSTHGRSGLGQVLFGSIARRVLSSGVKPVLLVRPGAEK
jgi:nucleotide-binding universal stress UspA family protein